LVRGDRVEIVSTEAELRAALGSIDTPGKAAFQTGPQPAEREVARPEAADDDRDRRLRPQRLAPRQAAVPGAVDRRGRPPPHRAADLLVLSEWGEDPVAECRPRRYRPAHVMRVTQAPARRPGRGPPRCGSRPGGRHLARRRGLGGRAGRRAPAAPRRAADAARRLTAARRQPTARDLLPQAGRGRPGGRGQPPRRGRSVPRDRVLARRGAAAYR